MFIMSLCDVWFHILLYLFQYEGRNEKGIRVDNQDNNMLHTKYDETQR